MTLVDRVTRRLRAARRACRTVVLRLRFDDFSRATRSHTIAEATQRTSTLLKVARGLLAASSAVIARRGLTLIGMALTNLCDQDAIQLALPFDRTSGLGHRSSTRCANASGPGAISRGALVGRDDGAMGAAAPGLSPFRLATTRARPGGAQEARSGSALVSASARR